MVMGCVQTSALQVAKKLKCSACRASAVEFHEALAVLRAKRGKSRIPEYEYTEVMDEVILTHG